MEVVERVAQVLGGRAVLRSTVRTWKDLERVVQAGLPRRSLQLVARRAVEPGAPLNEFVYSVVPARLSSAAVGCPPNKASARSAWRAS